MKHKIDLKPSGRAGVEAWYWDSGTVRHVWIQSTDHWRDWIHHFTPFAGQRETRYAQQIFDQVYSASVLGYRIAGHSWGGCLAMILGVMCGSGSTVVVFGAKRAPRFWHERMFDYISFRNRGDVIPFLPPWRPGYQSIIYVHDWAWPWVAHRLDRYDVSGYAPG